MRLIFFYPFLFLLLIGCAHKTLESDSVLPASLLQEGGQEVVIEDYSFPELKKLVQIALKNNLDLSKTRANVAVYEARMKRAQRTLWPSLSSTVSIGPDSLSLSSVSLSAILPLDLWGEKRLYLEQAQQNFYAAQKTYENTIQTLIHSLINEWFVLGSLKIQQKFLEQGVIFLKERKRDAWDAFSEGLISEKEFLQVCTIVYEWHKNQQAHQDALTESIERMNLLLGGNLSKTISFSGGIDLLDPVDRKDSQYNIRFFLKRPDVQAAWNRVLSQHALMKALSVAYLPHFSITDVLSFNFFSDLKQWGQKIVLAATNVLNDPTQPISRKEAKALVDQSLADYLATVYGAILHVRVLAQEAREAQHIYHASQEELMRAQEMLSMEDRNYRTGDGTYPEFLTARLNYLKASMAWQQDILALRVKRLNLDFALGSVIIFDKRVQT